MIHHLGGELERRLAKMGIFLNKSEPEEDDDSHTFILPEQFRDINEPDEQSIDQQIAFRLLYVNLLDLTTDNIERRLEAVKEIENWMANDATNAPKHPGSDGFEYTFELWCDDLGVNSDYMKRKMKDFLTKCKGS